MPEHDPNGAARRPVLKRVDPLKVGTDDQLAAVAELAAAGRLWVFCGEYDARGGETGAAAAADAAQAEHGPGIYQAFDAGSWGRGYWRG